MIIMIMPVIITIVAMIVAIVVMIAVIAIIIVVLVMVATIVLGGCIGSRTAGEQGGRHDVDKQAFHQSSRVKVTKADECIRHLKINTATLQGRCAKLEAHVRSGTANGATIAQLATRNSTNSRLARK
ncbi:hypothetical protein [Dyella humicola]|uniref:hypothetical protein n=1 Tax=Dyella humicola TaxID=2992126 RepID=UPI0022554A69|nr:hypothetical protein [Dyella humicola]